MSEAGPSEWAGFILDDHSFVDFAPGSRVLDVGCGPGEQVKALQRAGFDVVGVEPGTSFVQALVAEGYDVRHGFAEHLPFENGTFDGLVCKVVLPYTDERQAVREWARVLRPGARVIASYHGAGYFLRYLALGPGVALRFYGLRSIVNTWVYAATGRRLPGFIGDSVYQSEKRMRRYYDEFGLKLERVTPSRAYGGKPVFVYHQLRRLDTPVR